jgi:hypothetical protein
MLSSSFLQGERTQGCDWQAEKKTDSTIQRGKCRAKRPIDLLWGSLYCGRVGDTPVRRHRLTGPQWTNLVGCIVTYGKDKMKWWGVWLRELIPGLATKIRRIHTGLFNLLDGSRAHKTGWMATGAVRREVSPPLRRMIASAMIDRAELPVQRNNTL